MSPASIPCDKSSETATNFRARPSAHPRPRSCDRRQAVAQRQTVSARAGPCVKPGPGATSLLHPIDPYSSHGGDMASRYMLCSFKTCPWVQRAAIVLEAKQVPYDITYI